MDKSTRNSIQRATQAARKLLEGAYREQLEGTFDILLDGTIADAPGEHLTDGQKIIREKLVAAINHKRSAGLKAKEAVNAHLREAAFTTLNRFVALKMLEARQLVQECVSKGEDSIGFKEFSALAPGLAALPDKGYRLYIETLFDEIGQEVKVLFDRRDVASLLWPDRQTLLDLLGLLNTVDLAEVWAEDETIGWVYQYFNGDDERSKMREESQAPRNSRELAVRNQFFTPRYVVQFLTDNTLGRTWYEMMQGETKLSQLDYLVRRPNEAFLAEGEEAPAGEDDDSDLSQEELLNKTVYIPFRPKKDPRDLRILDPACGSGHFLLYAFDLLASIYEEAWSDKEAANFTETGTQLRADYAHIDDLRRAMPGLILRYNLHGVDIDPRAAQIAALALWMRAQRAYNQFEIARDQRPVISKTNIVVAEPMPGDAELVDEFASSLKPAVLGELFKKMVEEMKLAGELGSLLKIEESIAKAVDDAAKAHRQGSLFGDKMEGQDFWGTADEKIIAALRLFGESAAGARGVRKHLFADDASQGLALLDILRVRYDVVLMNPPFGVATNRCGSVIELTYPQSKRELAAAFVARAYEIITSDGSVGVISTKTPMFIRTYQKWRLDVLGAGRRIRTMIDLGRGVLDATVEATAYVLYGQELSVGTFFKGFESGMVLESIADDLRNVCSGGDALSMYLPRLSAFEQIPNCPIAYWADQSLVRAYGRFERFESNGRLASSGASTNDDFRFLRLWTEVPPTSLASSRAQTIEGRRWVPIAKGGEYSPFFRDLELVVNWAEDGRECKEYIGSYREMKGWGYSWSAALNGYRDYFRPGLFWSRRTSTWISPRLLPAGAIYGDKGPAAFVPNDDTGGILEAVMWLSSAPVGELLALSVGKEGAEGTAASNSYEVGVVENLPYASLPRDELQAAVNAVNSAIRCRAEIAVQDELSRRFAGAVSNNLSGGAGDFRPALKEAERAQEKIDRLYYDAYQVTTSARQEISSRSRISTINRAEPYEELLKEPSRQLRGHRTLSLLVGVSFGRWRPSVVVPRLEVPPTEELFQPYQERTLAMEQVERSRNILCWDEGAPSDIMDMVRKAALQAFGAADSDERLGSVANDLDPKVPDLRVWLRNRFFPEHIRQYSKSRRKAPIYWQLATPSASYAVWCYYHRLTRDTFFRIENDYVAPKLDHEERKLNELRQEAGKDPSTKQRKAIAAQESFVEELRAFKAEVARIAPLWNPNLNDGVILNFAPLWRLVPQHKPWQKECKKVWDKLVKGEYDWSHLAMHLWPERVVPKCAKDRSLAIAHGLEDDFWYEDNDGKWQKRKVDADKVQEFISERASTAVKAALNDLLAAPTPGGSRKARKGRSKG